jgi:hypothetical protein
MAAWKKWINSLPFAEAAVEPPLTTLEQMRAQVRETLRGCDGPMCERMRWRIDATRSAQDLWLLRSEIFQLVAGQHCQAEAAQRINGLIPLFEGAVAPRLLTRI